MVKEAVIKKNESVDIKSKHYVEGEKIREKIFFNVSTWNVRNFMKNVKEAYDIRLKRRFFYIIREGEGQYFQKNAHIKR